MLFVGVIEVGLAFFEEIEEEAFEELVIGCLFVVEAPDIHHIVLHLHRNIIKQLLHRALHLALHDLLSQLRLVQNLLLRLLGDHPREVLLHEVDQREAQGLQIVSPALRLPETGSCAGVVDGRFALCDRVLCQV